tara:strand:- start:1140 stop:2345 length:1206 start_codon:yes stop_codon:yes gene_type:complete
MGYTAVTDALSKYQWLLGNTMANTGNNLDNIKVDYAPVNPYSSGAYTPRSARNIYTGEGRETPNPIAAAKELESGMTTGEKLMMRGSQGLTYATLAQKASPYLTQGAQALSGGQTFVNAAGETVFVKNAAKEAFLASNPGATASSLNLAPSLAIYGLTRDQDPYSYSSMETAGTVASSYLAAQQLAPYVGMGTAVAGPVGIGIGILLSMLGKRSARRKKRAAEKKMKQYRDDMRDERYAAVEEGREEMQAQLSDQMARRREAMYDNQYGGNYNMRSYAEQGMKMDKNIVAEFTGNELVVNDQDALESDIAKGNNKSAANRIRMAMKGGRVTPGPETHKNNPMPVDSEGNIYAGGSALPFKANKGAGIYDHATDQFKMDMDDDTVVKVVKKNMKKWKKNNMA